MQVRNKNYLEEVIPAEAGTKEIVTLFDFPP